MTLTFLPGSDSYFMDISYQIDEETNKSLNDLYLKGDHSDSNGVRALLRKFMDDMPWCDHAEDLTNCLDDAQALFRVRLGINNADALKHPTDIIDSFGKWVRNELLGGKIASLKTTKYSTT